MTARRLYQGLVVWIVSWLSVGLSAQTRDVYSVEDVPNVQLIDSTRFVSDPNDAIPDDDEAALRAAVESFRSTYLAGGKMLSGEVAAAEEEVPAEHTTEQIVLKRG